MFRKEIQGKERRDSAGLTKSIVILLEIYVLREKYPCFLLK